MKEFFRSHKAKRILKALVFALIPLVSCMIYLLRQGMWFNDLYLPNSAWNDEIFYYKQIEGMVKYGIPQGYFGYESRAELSTFGAWSPVFFIPYAIVGKIVGWNLFTPFLCNILFVCIAAFVFAYTLDCSYRVLGFAAVFMCLFNPVPRYMLAGMCEGLVMALGLAFAGLFVKSVTTFIKDKEVKTSLTVWMFVISSVMTVIRPYYALLILIPGFYFIRRSLKRIPILIGIILADFAIYFVILKYMCASYFMETFTTWWLEKIYTPEGFKMALWIFAHGLINLFRSCVTAIMGGDMDNMLCAWTVFLILVLIVWFFVKKDRFAGALALGMIVMQVAVIMFYEVKTGGRHMIVFCLIASLYLFFSDKKNILSAAIVLAIVFLFTIRVGNDPYNYALAKYSAETAAEIEDISSQLEKTMTVDPKADHWDNTLIWVFYDPDFLAWRNLYAIPAGASLNMCYNTYVTLNWDSIEAKYIATNLSGSVYDKCVETGKEKIAQNDSVVIWKLRD